MKVSRAKLAQQLNTIGLQKGDIVMLHASVRAIGPVVGGPDQILFSVMDVINPTGTLMMYVGCDPEYESIGRKKLSQEEERLLIQSCPPFDYTSARARRDYGILAEFFRSLPGVLCSENPGGRMAALGSKALYLTRNHPLNYGYGPNSPLAKLYENDGKILLLGSDLDQVTILHYAESITPLPDKRIIRFKVPLLTQGNKVWCDIEEYDTSQGIRLWPDRFFAKIMKDFLERNHIQPQKVGNADSYLVEAKALVDYAVNAFIEESKNNTC
ncbi:TPA: aminoglycoside 3-N-acetyltransferase [Legionella pneumophila]|nr:aminoglycoside 3-N-acetyltransferase [Legionella pneumophila]HEL9659453.1 aminoglycoside 3-N-acetyltransferase [Legionella pneumophila]